jgi:hypothetical protein
MSNKSKVDKLIEALHKRRTYGPNTLRAALRREMERLHIRVCDLGAMIGTSAAEVSRALNPQESDRSDGALVALAAALGFAACGDAECRQFVSHRWVPPEKAQDIERDDPVIAALSHAVSMRIADAQARKDAAAKAASRYAPPPAPHLVMRLPVVHQPPVIVPDFHGLPAGLTEERIATSPSDYVVAATRVGGVDLAVIIGDRRTEEIVRLRWAAMTAAYEATACSAAAVGRAFARDPCVVLHAMRKMVTLRSDDRVRMMIAAITEEARRVATEQPSQSPQAPPSPADFVAAAAHVGGVEAAVIIGDRRTEEIVRLRWAAMTAAYEATACSAAAVGRAFALSHVTVLHARRMIACSDDPRMRLMIEAITCEARRVAAERVAAFRAGVSVNPYAQAGIEQVAA